MSENVLAPYTASMNIVVCLTNLLQNINYTHFHYRRREKDVLTLYISCNIFGTSFDLLGAKFEVSMLDTPLNNGYDLEQ